MRMRGIVALLALIWVCIGAGVARAQLEAVPPASGYVPPELAARVATRKAQQKWGSVTLGPVLPTCNADGELRAYLVCFALGGKPFPSEEDVAQSIREGRALYEAGVREGDREKVERGRTQISGADSFATVVVSATRDHYPIPAYAYGLPRYFTIADPAADVAREALGGGEARVSRIFFGSCAHQAFEFAGGSERVLVDADRLRVITEDDLGKKVPRGRRPSARPDEVARAWAALENVSAAPAVVARSPADHWVQHPGWVPFYPWTQGCSPTSAAMAMAYWDNSEVGGYCGYGMLVDYYLDAPMMRCEPYDKTNNPYHNVPNLLLELVSAFRTNCDGGTQFPDRAPGIRKVANEMNNYSFGSVQCSDMEPSFFTDYCWDKIKHEINANRPFVWSMQEWDVTHYEGHSVCAIGYDDDKYVILHDPNDIYTVWGWYYTSWCGSSLDAEKVMVDTVEPAGGSDGDNIRLGPRGGQTLYACQNYQINWTQSGTSIAKVDISYSTDGGSNWNPVATGVPSHEGVNSYSWKVPNVSTKTGRIWVAGVAADGVTWIAADGSYQNFTIAADTTPPPAPSFKINDGDSCTTSTAVKLSIQCASDCYLIRFKNGGTTTWSDWYACGSTKSWTLTSGYGPKTVYAQCQDRCGNIGPEGYDDTLYNLGPNAPSNLTATTEASTPVRIRLNWQDNSTNETGFKIERKVGSTGTYGQIAAVGANATTWADTTVSAGQTYCYRVRAYLTWAGDSAYSNEACACTAIPAAPTGMTATAVSGSQINLSWKDNSANETGFKIWRKVGTSGSWAVRATVGANVTSYQDTGLAPCTLHTYGVVAYNACRDSGASNAASATTRCVPLAPTNLTATAVSGSQINLSWKDNSANETGFRIWRKVGTSGSWVVRATVGANVTSYQDTGLTPCTLHTYGVVAYNSNGDSGASNAASATTPCVPLAPTNLTARAVSGSQINLAWKDNSTNETGFRILRRVGTSGSWALRATVGANVTSYQDTGLARGTVYTYGVVAYNSNGNSGASNAASAMTPLF